MSHLKRQIAEARARGDTSAVARMEEIERREAMSKAHPGFKSAQGKIAGRLRRQNPGMSEEEAHDRAGAILASASRRASASAKAHNPNLRKV